MAMFAWNSHHSPLYGWVAPESDPRSLQRTFGAFGSEMSANNGSVLAATAYSTDTLGEPARVYLKDIPSATLRRYNAVEIAFTCGYGAAAGNVPEPLRQAIKLLAAHWYENRVAVGEASQLKFEELPLGVQYLLAPYRLWGRKL